MIKDVNYYSVSKIFTSDDGGYGYDIHNYQRQYRWEKKHCQKLFDDIVENDAGYYLDRFLMVSIGGAMKKRLQVIDGQQRFISLTLLLAALYKVLSEYKTVMNSEELVDFNNLRRQIAFRDSKTVSGHIEYSYKAKLKPQKENHNDMDYYYILSDCGLTDKFDGPAPSHFKERRIYKRFIEFKRYIEAYLDEKNFLVDAEKINELFILKNKINAIVMVGIEVDTEKDAYRMFESLNNRGMPLSAIDLIKNHLFSQADKYGEDEVNGCYDKWLKMLRLLSNYNEISDTSTIGETFLRQYYNAFKVELEQLVQAKFPNKTIVLNDNATGANILDVYDVLIGENTGLGYKKVLQLLLEASNAYATILYCERNKDIYDTHKDREYFPYLCKLSHMKVKQANQLVMYILLRQDNLQLTDADVAEILRLTIVFCVKRNIMDNPAPRRFRNALAYIMSSVCCNNPKKGTALVDEVRKQYMNQFAQVHATEDVFERTLHESLRVGSNMSTISFVLRYVEDYHSSRENKRDIWNKEWTVEHVFPEGKNIPQEWVDEIADGNVAKANFLLETKCHCIGNLTLSKYNSNLSTKPYLEKRDKQDKDGKWIGYRNGLYLNNFMVNHDHWREQEINERTDILVEDIMKIFKWE